MASDKDSTLDMEGLVKITAGDAPGGTESLLEGSGAKAPETAAPSDGLRNAGKKTVVRMKRPKPEHGTGSLPRSLKRRLLKPSARQRRGVGDAPVIRVTADGQGMAQLGPNARAPLARKNSKIFISSKLKPADWKPNYLDLKRERGQSTFVPSIKLIEKYKDVISPSLAKNWARFIRGTGGFNFSGNVSRRRLNPGSDVAMSQYNPVLMDLYAMAANDPKHSWLADLMHSYYINYNETPFEPSEEQLEELERQLSGRVDEVYDALQAGSGKRESFTGLSRTSLKNIRELLKGLILRVYDKDYGAALSRLFEKDNALELSEDTGVYRLVPAVRSMFYRGKNGDAPGKYATDLPAFDKLILRAMMEEYFENPDLPARIDDPTGYFKDAISIWNPTAPEKRIRRLLENAATARGLSGKYGEISRRILELSDKPR